MVPADGGVMPERDRSRDGARRGDVQVTGWRHQKIKSQPTSDTPVRSNSTSPSRFEPAAMYLRAVPHGASAINKGTTGMNTGLVPLK